MLRDGGALPREAQSEAGRRPECLGSMEVVNCGDVYGDSTKRSNAHVEGIHVCHIILILRALIPSDPLVPAWKPAWRKRDTRQARMWLWHRVQLAL